LEERKVITTTTTMTIEPMLAFAKAQVKTIESLASFGYTKTDRLAQFNFYAGLAALDNSAYFLTTLIKSKDIPEWVELQMRAMLPAAESAKAYARQTLAIAAATSQELEEVIENQMSGFQSSDDAVTDVVAKATGVSGRKGRVYKGAKL
jgi:phasin family protein